jgi:hypothetical protein
MIVHFGRYIYDVGNGFSKNTYSGWRGKVKSQREKTSISDLYHINIWREGDGSWA